MAIGWQEDEPPLLESTSQVPSMHPHPHPYALRKCTSWRQQIAVMWRFVPPLLWKNARLKRKHPIATLVEVLTPVLFLVVMGVVKTEVGNATYESGWVTSRPDGGQNSFDTMVVNELSMHGLLLRMASESTCAEDSYRLNLSDCLEQVTVGGKVSFNASSFYAIPPECRDSVSVPKLAIVPDTTFTRQYFAAMMNQWYPALVLGNASAQIVIPSFHDSVVFYESEQQLEAFVTSAAYGALGSPRIYGAVVFDRFPRHDAEIGRFDSIEFTIRLNSTMQNYGDDAISVPSTLSNDGASTWNKHQRDIETVSYTQYASHGFMTLQTLVARFVNCMPEWNATSRAPTGKCQVAESTSNPTLDDQLVSTVLQDHAVMSTWKHVVGGSSTQSPPKPTNASTREALLRPLRQAPQSYLDTTVSPFPVQAYSEPLFFHAAVSSTLPLLMVLAYLYPLSKILVSLISERETRARELIKILSVKESSLVVSWYITYGVLLTLGAVLQTLATKMTLFERSSTALIFLFFFLFDLSVMGFAFMVSSAFSSGRTGVYVGLVAFLLLYAVSHVFSEAADEYSKTWACFSSPAALGFGVQALALAEKLGTGITFANAGVPGVNVRFTTTLVFFVIDFVLYTLLGLYFEKVVPKAYGTTEKWYFCLQPSYWKKKKTCHGDSVKTGFSEQHIVNLNPNIEDVSADLVEQERSGHALCVQRLRKVFRVPGGEKEAVKGLSLNMYAGQITCLLGHNGAGKTTLISMLTGVLNATSGDAYYRGLSMSQDMDEIRESLGICFQHDVLYPELTVQEHVEFYARIKGYQGSALAEEVEKKITEVGLADKRTALASALSGGMKRKLSVAIALLGDSSLVFLDEPTSGMDPYSRRSTWEVLLNNRQNRILVLTTHFMDEADVLGDRIAIMAEGELRCCGSPLFLKNRYGAGYNLTIVKQEGCNDSKVIDFVTRHIASAQVLSNVGTEIAFQLPLDTSSRFPRLFRDLDAHLTPLMLRSYGISVTTMEEVFIKVAEASDEDQEHTLKNKVKHHNEEDAHTIQMNDQPVKKTTSLFINQLVALLQKRFRIAKRDKRMFTMSLALPIGLLFFGLSALTAPKLNKAEPKMTISLSNLQKQVDQIGLPSFCMTNNDDKWCNTVLGGDYFSEGTPVLLDQSEIGNPPYDTDSPTVFGVTYDDPKINRTGPSGHLLKLNQVVYQRAFERGIKNQFGGFLVQADAKDQVFSYNTLVNSTLPHGSVAFKGMMDQALYRFMASKAGSDASGLRLVVSSHPLPPTATNTARGGAILALGASSFIMLAFAYYPASLAVLLVKEKHAHHNSKHQQLVSGAQLTAFWLANLLWDFLVYLVPLGVALILLRVYDMPAFTGSKDCITCTASTFPAVVLLFVLFGLAICPFAYCCTFMFKEHASAQTYIVMINMVFGLVLVIASMIMDGIDATKDINKTLKYVWRMSPMFDFGTGLMRLAMNELSQSGMRTSDADQASNDPFAWENLGSSIIFLIISAIFYMALAIAMDYALTFPKFKSMLSKDPNIPPSTAALDEDVAAEAARVASERASDDTIKLQNLRKVYRKGNKVAVEDLSFGLKKGECFGFLGINGAGKTTTMKMLTGDIVPTSGQATLAGFDILTQQLDVRREIGYCPQFDALIDLLTVREHLELFGRIKGISTSQLDGVVRDKMEQLNLLAFEHKLAGSLSGGDKRKLSVAIAMIGSPSILFLDEPSTGMDPVSRRFMWDVISEISTYNKESTIVLTTHSMEECEALCTRVGIMVDGGLKCLGSVQHLKTRFGDGLTIHAKLAPACTDDIEALVLQQFDLVIFEGIIMKEQVAEYCSRYGRRSWRHRISRSHPTGYFLANLLKRDGYVTATAFSTWWLNEERFEAMSMFFRNKFGAMELLERQNDSCWFKISESAVSNLADVFELIEDAKASLLIPEYSVSQTTLEQIFNSFASRQKKPEQFI